jgi:hypothetical protein
VSEFLQRYAAHLGADDALFTHQFEPGMYSNPESELLGADGNPSMGYAHSPLLAPQHQAGFVDWLSETMSADWLPGSKPDTREFTDPAELPYRVLLQEFQRNRQSHPTYADALEAEIKRRAEVGDFNEVPDESADERLVAAATKLLGFMPEFKPKTYTPQRKAPAAPYNPAGDASDYNFTGSPETQYHHRQDVNWGEINRMQDPDSIEEMYERARQGLPIHQ